MKTTEVSHAPAKTEDLIRWLRDPSQTITQPIRDEIAARLGLALNDWKRIGHPIPQ